jgi:hypothetical protein
VLLVRRILEVVHVLMHTISTSHCLYQRQSAIGLRPVLFVPLGAIQAAQPHERVDLFGRGASPGQQHTEREIGFALATID